MPKYNYQDTIIKIVKIFDAWQLLINTSSCPHMDMIFDIIIKTVCFTKIFDAIIKFFDTIIKIAKITIIKKI